MPNAFFSMSLCRFTVSSSRRSFAFSSSSSEPCLTALLSPLLPWILLHRFRLHTDTPSSWLSCLAVRCPLSSILTASRWNSSSNRFPYLLVVSFILSLQVVTYTCPNFPEHSNTLFGFGTSHPTQKGLFF